MASPSSGSPTPSPSSPQPPGGQPGRDPLSFGISVAGEEDPGAAFDNETPQASGPAGAAPQPGASDQPAGQGGRDPRPATPPLAPGDEAAPGTPGTGENLCPACGGTGRRAGAPCTECAGTGRVTVGIGGA
ncbi:hypothetical protein C8247_15190 [Paracidovorax avenae]|uniref:hypothetical protein n=1 Tax=Paracidovorax avenae TaxID=80867 RepID=UPI000D177F73|nr:hypothetical protein [Paracidovorax avenae]AVS71632.1 hypothetical protein C8247_15190 [Paracidovorax avenae]